ncbi:histidine kinase [Sphingomonas sp. AOB5]|uniref:sensor histidine kinase n=1 Tax=Sphingomonas sp. AOB5 TaxID=3034017 RepID=UPI0023F635D3|nr:ATP-binding protein [Sphingomonas sp. AOB5]MDF7776096.1 histidine kinase [Sphingomonas sp. AOB5]
MIGRDNRAVWLRALAAIAASQLIFWLFLGLAEKAALPAGMQHRPYVEFTILDEAGNPLADGRKFRAPYRPDPNYKVSITEGSARALFEIPFTVADPQEELGLYLAVRRSIQEVRVNGVVVQPNVPLDSFTGSAGWESVFYVLPKDAVRKGGNRITALVENEGYSHVFPVFHVGPADDLVRAFGWGGFFNVDLPLAAIAILVFTALLCLIVNWPAEDRRRVNALIVLLLVWALRDWSLAFTPPFAMSKLVFWVVFWTLSFAIIFASARYVLRDAGAPDRWVAWLGRGWIAAQLSCFGMPLLEGRIGPDAGTWFRMMTQVELWLTFLLCGGSVLLLAREIGRSGGERWGERLMVMLCLTALIVDIADGVFKLTIPFAPGLPLTFYVAPIAGVLLGMAMITSLARQATEARRAVTSANERLAGKLAAREAELAETYRQREAMTQRQTLLEERQRIVRDMHDGIGGRLVGLILQVRGRAIEADGVERALEDSVSDLRLIVDSLDPAEDSLSAALASFEYRIRAQAEAAGIAFTAAIGDLPGGPGPRTTLQILRVLQEAVTNALRHAGAKSLRLEAGVVDGQLKLAVIDDGKGFDGTPAGGRGVVSMQARARTIGATLAFEGGKGGTAVRLDLPLSDAGE